VASESNIVSVSVIVGVKDRHDLLPRLIASLLKQTLSDWELIIVDQGVPLLAASIPVDPRIRVIRSEPGLSHARNLGLQKSHGEFISLLDDDCWLDEHALKNAVIYFRANPEVAALVGRVFDESGHIFKEITKCLPGELRKWDLLVSTLSVGILLRSTTLKKLGLRFDESLGLGSKTELQSGEDADILLSLQKKGGSIFQLDEYKVYHPSLGDSPPGRLANEGLCLGYLMRRYRFFPGLLVWWSLLSLGFSLVLLLQGKLLQAKSRALFTFYRLRGFSMPPVKRAE